MAAQTDQQLQDMFARPADWTPQALDVARAELRKRNVDISHIVPIAAKPRRVIWPSYGVLVLAVIVVCYGFSQDVNLGTFLFVTLPVIACVWWFVVSRKRERNESTAARVFGYLLFFIGIVFLMTGVIVFWLIFVKSNESAPLISKMIQPVISLVMAVGFIFAGCKLTFRRADKKG